MISTVKVERDNQGRLTYQEYSDGSWEKREYDQDGRETYQENSKGWWKKCTWENYNGEDRIIYHEESSFWTHREYNNKGREVFYEDSTGYYEKCFYDNDDTLIYKDTSKGTMSWSVFGKWMKKDE